MTTERPTTLLAEVTHRCPLHCPYCSNPLDLLRAESEIGTEDWKRVFTQARELGVLQLGLSGGEPLVRKDLEELAAHARGLGLYTTLVTSGLGLTRKRAEALRAAGLEHVQVSVQDADPETAERIAGVSSVKQKLAAIALVKELGFAFSINVVLHRANLDRIGSVKAPIPILGLSNGARTGLTGFCAGIARQVSKDGVTINGLLPGPFDTDRLRSSMAFEAKKAGRPLEDIVKERAAHNPARRFGTPEEFGAACAFLCSTHAGYITGQNLLMDGGAVNSSI